MPVAPEHIKAPAPEGVWFPNGRGEIGQTVAELNRARVALEQDEAPMEDVYPQPGELEVEPDDMEAAWRDFIEKPEDDDLWLNVEEDKELEDNTEAPPQAPDAGIIINRPPPCDRGPAEFRRRCNVRRRRQRGLRAGLRAPTGSARARGRSKWRGVCPAAHGGGQGPIAVSP